MKISRFHALHNNFIWRHRWAHAHSSSPFLYSLVSSRFEGLSILLGLPENDNCFLIFIFITYNFWIKFVFLFTGSTNSIIHFYRKIRVASNRIKFKFSFLKWIILMPEGVCQRFKFSCYGKLVSHNGSIYVLHNSVKCVSLYRYIV